MDKIIQFKKLSYENIKKKYELEGCDDKLLELAEKLVQCNPAGRAYKKKEALKTEYLKRSAEYKASLHASQGKPFCDALSDEDLDAAAGGLLHPEDIEDPLKND